MDARTRLIELIQAYAGGGGAPTNATYVTLSTNGTLTNERVLTAGTGITLTDAGAGSTITVAVTSSTYQPLDADLTTLAATTSTDGHVWRRAGGTWAYGTLDHSALSAVAWTSSGHTGTASRVAAFDGGGAASYLQVGVDLQAYSATLASIAAGTWTGAASITTLGAIATGTWQGTAIAAAYLGSHTHAASDITSGVLATARLGSGSPSSSTLLDGSGAWRALTATDLAAAYPAASTTTFSQTSSTTMTTACSISGVAVGTYRISGLVAYVSPTAAGIKIQLELTGTGSVSWWVTDRDSGALAAWTSASTPNYSSSTGNTLRATLEGVLRVTSGTGALALKLAQNTSTGTATTAEARIQLLPF